MTATYIHTRRSQGISSLILRLFAVLYFAGLLLAVGYVWVATQDRFISTACFRIAREDAAGSIGGLAQMVLPGISDSGAMDSQIAASFVESVNLLLDLEREFDLVKHYSSPQRDLVFRLAADASLEDRIEYYRQRICTHFNKETGLTTVTVDSFDPQLSKRLLERVLMRVEDFVNTLNQQIADERAEFVQAELDRTSKQVDAINGELLAFQNKHNIISPDEAITGSLSVIRELKMQQLQIQAEIESILRDSPNSARVKAMESRLKSINQLIDVETAKISGPDQDRLNQILTQFKQLEMKLDFAVRLRSAAQILLEKNRVEALSRSRFLSMIQPPFLPEEAIKPARPYATVTILVVGSLLFVAIKVLANSALDRG